ncbi:Uma2 family endonuclease [Sphingomonas bacterium]|uniref:Uma2 family endonuclease n=1 Tax=Sphingomonas bacterium TaxID=1895847 RepID=UPI001576CABA|nr:Uma2 family endonuclease [Sphingomonas bacterium]
MATQSDQRLLTSAEFLRIDFGSDIKAELDNGVIRMMAGGSVEHARVQMNLYRYLGLTLRGSGCRPFGSDMAIETAHRSTRYPDVTVDCSRTTADDAKALSDPRVIFEILSPSTRREDEGVKLDEYSQLASVDTIVLVDPSIERVRILQRASPEEWNDRRFLRPTDVALPSLGITIPHDEIFARD